MRSKSWIISRREKAYLGTHKKGFLAEDGVADLGIVSSEPSCISTLLEDRISHTTFVQPELGCFSCDKIYYPTDSVEGIFSTNSVGFHVWKERDNASGSKMTEAVPGRSFSPSMHFSS